MNIASTDATSSSASCTTRAALSNGCSNGRGEIVMSSRGRDHRHPSGRESPSPQGHSKEMQDALRPTSTLNDVAAVLTDRSGASHAFSAERLDAVLAELELPTDVEHPDVAVTDESGWSLSASSGGLVVWENVNTDDPPRHRHAVERSEVKLLFEAVGRGALPEVELVDWQPGYGA
jgi:hypothetical protein